MIFGLRLLGGYLGDTRMLVKLGVLAEKAGFDFCWFAHDPFMRSSWVTATAIATLTTKIKLGLNFKPYTIDPYGSVQAGIHNHCEEDVCVQRGAVV